MTHDLWQALTSLEGGKSSAAEARACLATLWDEVRLCPLCARICRVLLPKTLRHDTCLQRDILLALLCCSCYTYLPSACVLRAQVKVLVPSLQ